MKKKILIPVIFIICLHTLFSCSGGGSGTSADSDSPAVSSVTQTVGTEGGTIRSSDGSWQMTIPAGALTASTQITIKSGATPAGSIPQGFTETGGIFRFEPHGLTFSKPVTFRFKYNQGSMPEAGIEERLISFYFIKDDSTVEKADGVVDTASNTVEVEVNHFSFGGPLTMAIRLVNNGIITNPAIVSFISDRVAEELRSLPNDQARQQFYQDNAELLAPFMERLDTVLGSNPIATEFPAVDFSDPGTVSTKPYAVLFGEPSRYTNNNDCYIEIGGSNVVAYQYKIDNGEWSAETDISTPIVQWGFAEGSHTIRVIGKNISGEWQDDPTVWTWHVDCSVPTAGDVTLTGLPSDPTPLSSINVSVGGGDFVTYRYRIDAGTWSAETGISSPIKSQGLGESRHSLEVIVKNPAGNWQDITNPFRYEWTTDYTAPGGTFAINNGIETTASQSVTLNLSVNGADEMCFSNDGITYSSWEPYNSTRSWSLSNEYGDKTVYGKFRDRAGHEYQTADGISYAEFDPGLIRVVVWGRGTEVYGRLINATNGTPLGEEFIINPSNAKPFYSESLRVVVAGGRALVVWATGLNSLHGRIFDITPTGAVGGDVFLISGNASTSYQDIVVSGSRALVVMRNSSGIIGHIVDIANGTPVGNDFDIASSRSFANDKFMVTVSGNRGIVIWQEGSSQYNIFGRVVDMDACAAAGTVFGVTGYGSGFTVYDYSVVQLNNRALVVWAYCINHSTPYYIHGRYIDCSSCAPMGDVFVVGNSADSSGQHRLVISGNDATVVYQNSTGLIRRSFDISSASQTGSSELTVGTGYNLTGFTVVPCGSKEIVVWEVRHYGGTKLEGVSYDCYSVFGRFINTETSTLLGSSDFLISTGDPRQQDTIRTLNTHHIVTNEINGKVMVAWMSGEWIKDENETYSIRVYYKIFGHTIDVNTMQPEAGDDVILVDPYYQDPDYMHDRFGLDLTR